MSTPSQGVESKISPRSGYSARLEALTRVGAITAGGIYIAGFVIVTLHHAQYGIGEIGLLKARVLSAGILFAILTALPVVITARVYGYFGFSSAGGVLIDTPPGTERIRDWIVGIGLYLPCYGISLATTVLFQDEYPDQPLWWLVSVIGGGGVLAFSSRFKAHPRTLFALYMITVIAFGWGLYEMFGRTFLLRSLWFYVCALATRWAYPMLHDPRGWRAFEWERHTGVFIGLVLFFAQFVYGRIHFKFGGGETVPVRLYLNSEAPKLFSGEPADASLIEETDSGFYVLRKPDDRESVFVPRTVVRAIEFNPKLPDGSGSQRK